MRIILIELLCAIVLFGASPAFAATAWWSEPGIVVQADEAITPADSRSSTKIRPLMVGLAALLFAAIGTVVLRLMKHRRGT